MNIYKWSVEQLREKQNELCSAPTTEGASIAREVADITTMERLEERIQQELRVSQLMQ
jgi:hypothetical protein